MTKLVLIGNRLARLRDRRTCPENRSSMYTSPTHGGGNGNHPMMVGPVLLAGVNRENFFRELIPSHSTTFDTMAIFGTILLVTLVVFVWAVLSRARCYRRNSNQRRSRPAPAVVSETANRKQSFGRPEGQDLRQREQFPRNPTLAEIGGLPPLFHEKQHPPLA